VKIVDLRAALVSRAAELAGRPATERVTSAGPARVLDVGSPPGFERFIAATGKPATALTLPPPDPPPPDVDLFTAIAAEYGIELLGPPGRSRRSRR
jgi:hypothetical protein